MNDRIQARLCTSETGRLDCLVSLIVYFFSDEQRQWKQRRQRRQRRQQQQQQQ